VGWHSGDEIPAQLRENTSQKGYSRCGVIYGALREQIRANTPPGGRPRLVKGPDFVDGLFEPIHGNDL
jgi:hypothetical protein